MKISLKAAIASGSGIRELDVVFCEKDLNYFCCEKMIM